MELRQTSVSDLPFQLRIIINISGFIISDHLGVVFLKKNILALPAVLIDSMQ